MKKFEQVLTEQTMQEIVQCLLTYPHTGNYQVTVGLRKKSRTYLQNRSMHLYFSQLSTAMNDAGYMMRIVGFRPDFEIPWTPHAIKDIFRLVGTAMFGIESTTELSTTQIQSVYLAVDQRFAELSGISIEWPKDEPPMMQEHNI